MKHILLNFNHYRTPKDLGGLRSWHIGTYLAKQGYLVSAVVPGVDTLTGKKKETLKGRFSSKKIIDGVEVIWVNATRNDRTSKIKRAFYYFSFSLLQAITLVRYKKVDLIISMSMPFTSMLFSLIYAKFRKIPFAIDVRDLPTDTAVELGYLNLNGIVRGILKIEKWLFKKSDCLIAVSNGWATRLKNKGISSNKIYVVPLGFDGKEIYEHHTDWNRNVKEELGLSGKFVVAYCGTLGHVFDIPTILDTAQKTVNIRNIIYIFAGGGQQIDNYKKEAEDKGLNCIFLGPRPKADVPLICSQMDVCICPYKQGEFVSSILGNKIFDYMGNGTATIYTGPKGDVSRLLNDSSGGISLDSGDSDGMASAIIELYRDPQQLSKLGYNAKNYINQNFTSFKMMRDFEKIISMLL
jgi:colanic acid biosynthesis glycosyl transferase WcaI